MAKSRVIQALYDSGNARNIPKISIDITQNVSGIYWMEAQKKRQNLTKNMNENHPDFAIFQS